MSNPAGDPTPPTPPTPPFAPVPVAQIPLAHFPVTPLPMPAAPVAAPLPWAPIPVVAVPEADPMEPGQLKRSAIAAIAIAVVLAVGGLGVGLLWLQVAPRVEVIKVDGGFQYAVSQPEQAVGADLWFGLLGLIVGGVAAAAAWVLLRRYRGAAVLLGLVVGSLAGAWLAWWLGVRLGFDQFDSVRDSAPIGTHLDAPLVLRITDLDRHDYWPPKITGVVAAQAMMAAAVYTSLAGFSNYPNLRRPPTAGSIEARDERGADLRG